ncbi:glycosyltransferase family 4 protein [soil metagenome]
MRIGFLCSEYPPEPHGGIGSLVHDLAEGLVARGAHVVVAGYGSSDSITNGAVTVHRFARPKARFSKPLTALEERLYIAQEFRRIASEERLQLVEVPDYRGEGAFLKVDCPILCRYHGSATALSRLRGAKSSRLTRYLEGRGIRRAKFRVAASSFIDRETRRFFPQIPAADAVIPNFIDTEMFRPADGVARDGDRILFVGHVSPNKGIDLLFRALPIIFREHPAAHLIIAGKDTNTGAGQASYTGELLGMLDEGSRARVTFLGRVDRSALPRIYSESAVLAMPGDAEAFGIVALEAMACGCALVSGLHGGPAEFIRAGVTGLTADSASAEQYAAAILRLLSDGALRESISQGARADVCTRFSREAVLSLNEDFYRKVLAAK